MGTPKCCVGEAKHRPTQPPQHGDTGVTKTEEKRHEVDDGCGTAIDGVCCLALFDCVQLFAMGGGGGVA